MVRQSKFISSFLLYLVPFKNPHKDFHQHANKFANAVLTILYRFQHYTQNGSQGTVEKGQKLRIIKQ